MILANDLSWVICTPTKCGTYSLEATLIDRLKVAHKYNPHNTTAHRHNPVYEGLNKDKIQRIFITRHPLERWASMYWFTKMHADRGNGIYLSDYTSSVNEYAAEWIKRREANPYPMWTNNNKENFDKFWADRYSIKVFKVEDGLQKVIDWIGYDAKISFKNVTKDGHDWKYTTNLLNASNRKYIINEYAQEDIDFFSYD